MQYRVNPKNGDKISALGLGCMRFPGAPGRPDPKVVRALIARAVELGVNYLDTAYIYPGSEAAVGAALEELGLRDRVLVATKLPHAACKRPEDLDRILGEQLRRLRTDRVDYYLVHNVTSPAQWERLRGLGVERWIAAQKEAGRIRRIGFSYHGSADDFLRVLGAYDWDFCQIQYNYTGERYQAGTAGLKAAAARGIAVFIMEPLLGGRLADKLPKDARRTFEAARGEAARLADGYRLSSPADWGLAWVWDHPEVTMVLSGMTAPEQVDQNAALASHALPGALTPAQHEVVAQVVEKFNRANRVRCTGCGYCMPCPHGVNIPGCFAAYNASYAHSWFTGAWQYYAASAVRTAEPKLASNCVRCGRCARRCPQHIDIPAELAHVCRRFQPGPVGAVLKLFARTRAR